MLAKEPKKQGFASLTKARHRRVSSKGGRRKVPKGTALLPVEDRLKRARDAANARWEKARREKQEKEPINSQEDGEVRDI